MGYVGNILRVDLTRGTTEFEALDRFRAKNFIGGRGLGISYLLEEVDPRCDPLSAENKLVMIMTASTRMLSMRKMTASRAS